MPAKSTIWRRSFNTSYVVIKPCLEVDQEAVSWGFNTSYVVIKHFNISKFILHLTCFNTSYVVIKLHDSCRNNHP